MNVYETHAGGARVRAWQRTGPCALGLRLRVCACVFFLFTSATRAQDATTPGSDAAEGGEGERDQSDAAEANREGAGEAAPAITPPTLEEPPPTPQAPGSVGGRARFQVLIDETGAVSEAAPDGITLDSLAASLDVEARRAVEISVLAIALDYVQRLRFTPARQGDEALAVRIAFEVAVPPRQLPRSDASMDSPDASVSPDAADATESDEAEGPAPAGESGGAESGEADADEDEGFGASASVDAPVRERSGSTAGDFDVDIGDLRRVPRVGAQSMLTLVPGVLLTQHANEGHALAVYLRGFDAGEGEDLEVLVDGMPINEISNAHGHGYVDPLFAIPDVVDSLRVVQGPFDPAQGDFATAGTAEYRLGVRERGVHLSLGYGRFDELRFSGVWAPAESEDGTFIALSYNQGDGFGPNRSFRNGSAIGRYEGLSGKLRYSLMAFGATGTWLSANVVRADDVSRRRVGQAEGEGGTDRCGTSRDAQFFCLYDPNQGGSTQQAGIVGRLRHGDNNRIVEATLFGRLRSLRIQENFTGFSTDPRTDGGPQRGDNQDQQYEATTIGARFRYRLARSFFNFAQRFEAGLQLRYDDALTRADRRRDSRGTPYRTDFDREVRETLVGAYARAELQFLSWLRVIGGARLDFFGFNVTDNNFSLVDDVGERLERRSFSAAGVAASPRGTIRATLVEGFDFVFAAGLGARSTDAAALSEAELAPFARVTALEAGLVFDREFGPYHVEARGSLFTTRVSQDLVFNPEAGRNTRLGPSSRGGGLLQARFHYGVYLDLLGSVTYTRAHLQPAGSGVFDLFEGPRLPFVPSWVGRLDASGTLPVKIRDERVNLGLAIGAQFVGPRPLPLEEVAERYFLLDFAASARWRFLEVRAAVRNLFDARYRSEEFVYTSNFRDPQLPPSMLAARHFAAGAPRTYLLTIALHLDPSGSR